jgi:hypothetical protein
MSDELEDRLRRALTERADRVDPAPDGLSRIRQRTQRTRSRSDRLRLRGPAMALAGTVALVGAVLVAPSVLPALSSGRDDTGAGTVSAAPSSPVGGSAAGTAPGPTDTPVPGAGVNDLVTVWPYASRAEGYARAEQDVAAGRYPDLTQPDLVAVTFVGSYVGTSRELAAESAGRWKAGLRMRVSRAGVPVSLVYLVRVRVGDDAPYVVVEATAPDLTLTVRPAPGGVVTAGGRRADRSGAAPYAQLRRPGADEPLATARAAVRPGTDEWSVRLVPPGPRPRTGAVAAWTLDADGRLTAFAAASAPG